MLSPSALLLAGLLLSGAALGSPNSVHAQTLCLSHSEVSEAIKKLALPGSPKELASVTRKIRAEAKRSAKCRTHVVNQLMAAMGNPDLATDVDQATYNTWQYGALLLAGLRATEALDLLIDHLNLTDGLSINHLPVRDAVISFGPIAVPKLRRTAQNNPNIYVRKSAIFCIASIGGLSARNSLEALNGESDRCNKEFIEASLNAFKNQRSPNRIIFDPERSKWYEAYYCHE
jgi:HEAT repeat protein